MISWKTTHQSNKQSRVNLNSRRGASEPQLFEVEADQMYDDVMMLMIKIGAFLTVETWRPGSPILKASVRRGERDAAALY